MKCGKQEETDQPYLALTNATSKAHDQASPSDLFLAESNSHGSE
jgi:hypothetical protein